MPCAWPDLGTDAGASDASTDAAIYTTCETSLPEGAACAFTTPCELVSDGAGGLCGQESWQCVDGSVVHRDFRVPCASPDLGTDAGTSADADGAVVYTRCDIHLPEGAACTFTTPCELRSDGCVGLCGSEAWQCVGGLVVHRDFRMPCRCPDLGR
jgi:hypothetical protein